MGLFETIFPGWIAITLGSVGVLLNLFGLFFLAKTKNKTCFLKLLMKLVTIDMLLIVNQFFFTALTNVSPSYISRGWPVIIPYLGPVTKVLITSSIYLTMAIVIERYLPLVHPFFLLRHPFLSHSRAFSLPCLVFSCLFCVPNWWRYFQELGRDGHLITRADMQLNYGLTALFNAVIHMALLVTLSVLIRRKLGNSIIDRFRGGELRRGERKIARIGFVIAVLFLTCQSIAGVLNVLEFLGTPLPYWLWSVAGTFVTVNSSGNFLVYFIHSGDVSHKVFRLLAVKRRSGATECQGAVGRSGTGGTTWTREIHIKIATLDNRKNIGM